MFGSFRTISLSLRQKLCNSLALPFSELLEIGELDELVKNSKVKFYHRLYTPVVTILVFMAQVLDSDRSCRQAVSRLVGLTAPASSQGQKPSQNTAAYCKARLRLPLTLIWKLIEWSRQRIDAQVGADE